MEIAKSLLLFLAVSFHILTPYKLNQNGKNRLPQSSVLGETTGGQVQILQKTVGGILGCDYETTCRDFCSKPENKQHCYDVVNSVYATIMPTRAQSSSRQPSPSPSMQPPPSAYPTTTAEQTARRQRFIREIKTRLGCDYETTCRDFCSKPENQQRCTEVINYLYASIMQANSSVSSNRSSSASSVSVPTAKQSSSPISGISSAKATSAAYFARPGSEKTASMSLTQIKEYYQKAYEAIQKEGGPEREAKLKALQQQYYLAASQAEAKTVSGSAKSQTSSAVSEKEHFKEQLSQIKNTVKRQAVETINVKITAINEKYVTAMNTSLYKLGAVLEALISQLNSMPAETADLAAVKAEAVQAQAALSAAQKAVLDQSVKTYPLEVSGNEAKLKEGISPTVAMLTADLKQVRQLVTVAKEAITKVYKDTYRIKAGVR